MAASYAMGIYPFLDGNKRTGLMLAAAFLEMIEVTFGKRKQAAYAEWLGRNSEAV